MKYKKINTKLKQTYKLNNPKVLTNEFSLNFTVKKADKSFNKHSSIYSIDNFWDRATARLIVNVEINYKYLVYIWGVPQKMLFN